ncbi:complement component C1q receptor [Scleropages formosus]|uniref:complement component C1q receptor n=1 Tax=Scleropages formosus TaxID=113540 RepID=UPI0010FAB673|nr:complement component C1q receptor-like [Scleropages formosus]
MMLLVLLLFPHHLLVDGIMSDPAETVCMGNACYTFHLERAMFEGAQKHCQENGGNLAVVKTKKEARKVQEILTHLGAKHEQKIDLKFWIGLKLHKGQCTVSAKELRGFQWVSGEEDTQYANWEREPKSTCTEDRCVAVHHRRLNADDLVWTERSCKDHNGFVCKFNFRGMCKAFPLVEPSKITYTTPFAQRPVNKLTVLPHGTSADLSCDSQHVYSICHEKNGCFGWTNPGSSCDFSKKSCKDGLCYLHCASADLPSECQEGYELGEDGVTCIQKDFCKDSPCKFKCVSGPQSYRCQCPPGFQVAKDQTSCVDVNECSSHVCDQLCINTNGSYTCLCKEGYKMTDGKCRDIDECSDHRCPQGCVNTHGSFSCYCHAGFNGSNGGQTCDDINECQGNPCDHDCENTAGSYKCSCRKGFRLAADGIECIADSRISSSKGEDDKTDILNDKKSEVLEHTLPPTSISEQSITVTFTDTYNVSVDSSVSQNLKTAESNKSVRSIFSHTWMFVSIVSSVGALLFLIIVTSVVVVCRRYGMQQEKKKHKLTADSYCWVSSGCEVQKEKMQEQK